MPINATYLLFALLSLAAFRWLKSSVAVLVVFLGGWVLLPLGHFPAGSTAAEFPYWITGLAIPSDLWLNKAWIAPLFAVLGVCVFDRQALTRLRPEWMDAPMALWCLYPLFQATVVPDPAPSALGACAYLLGTWGLPWLLGRLYFTDRDGLQLLAKGLAFSALACLPFSLIEGVIGPKTYGWIYELHPFRLDGDVRYIGYRPLGFFENGNQFGLWISLCALAAVWLALSKRSTQQAGRYRWVAIAVVAMALAAQSIGGILLLAVGSMFLAFSQTVRPRQVLIGALAVLLLGGAVYVSGAVPILKLGRETSVGRHVVDAFKSVGRGSFTWRVAQDQRLLHAATQRPLVGTGHWDWWRSEGSRPWGLALLIVGQFGIVGLILGLAALLLPAVKATWSAPRAGPWQPSSLPLMMATIIALTVVDALMNSFVFFPALMVAGGLAGMSTTTASASSIGTGSSSRPRGEITRVARRV